MYTIKQASLRTGVTVPLLRAWERRYGIPSPVRTDSGYRLYDDAALARIRQMRALVESGWTPSQAARAILEGRGDEAVDAAAAPSGARERKEERAPAADAAPGEPLPVERFVAAASALDEATLDDSLAEAFATLGSDEAVTRFALPALVAVGEAWAGGRMDVSGEHAASSAVMRRLGALYEASGQPAAEAQVIVGLPPHGRHEIGALAFAVACRRAGLRVVYLGADVPLASWRLAVRAQPLAAVVLAAVTRDEARAAHEVVRSLHAEHPNLVIALGGPSADAGDGDAIVLPQNLRAAVATLRNHLAR